MGRLPTARDKSISPYMETNNEETMLATAALEEAETEAAKAFTALNSCGGGANARAAKQRAPSRKGKRGKKR